MTHVMSQNPDEREAVRPAGSSTMSDLASRFVVTNRALRAADNPDDAAPALQEMQAFLSVVGELLEPGHADRWSPADSARLFALLLTLMAEAPQYRHEQIKASSPEAEERVRQVRQRLLPPMTDLRREAVALAKRYVSLAPFESVRDYVTGEIHPMLDSMGPDRAPDRYMPFRVIHIGNIVERLWSFRFRTADAYLVSGAGGRGLLEEIYRRKYLRFGTSGVRARWGFDFTEPRARQVVQAICTFLKGEETPPYVGAENLQGKRIVVGYDSRRNAATVARWVAEVCLGNGFRVDLANRDTPTPALVYYLTEHLGRDEVAGLINCTPSHNPPEWQGIKFNPRLGYPAPTNVTDYIAAYTNDLHLLDQAAAVGSTEEASADGRLRGFDPIAHYAEWILDSGRGNDRILLDHERMREFFAGRHVVVDEMHGAGRGYLSHVLGAIGIRHTVIHAERDPDLPGLDYANPEEPYIDPLKDRVRESHADLGVALDTDADRFGIVDRGGVYFRPNQILPMLVNYLGVERGLTGRVIATQTGSPLIEVLAGRIGNQDGFLPQPGVVPAYVSHPFYRMIVGTPQDRVYEHTFLVPVGVKYIEEIRRSDSAYRPLACLPEGWRSVMLIGGEESSGLSTRGHVPDKDGIWGDLLIMDMLAYYGTVKGIDSIDGIWRATVGSPGCWTSYGGTDTMSGRVDVDAVVEAKEGLIGYFLDLALAAGRGAGQPEPLTFAGLTVKYLGGVRYDVAELQLCDAGGDCRHFLRVRSSGTEPISRIYVESSDPDVAARLMRSALARLEQLCVDEIRRASSEWRLADVVAVTSLSPTVLEATRSKLAAQPGWSAARLVATLRTLLPSLERRSQRTCAAWIDALDRVDRA